MINKGDLRLLKMGLNSFLTEKENLNKLLALEKKRRKIPQDKLLFIGTADTAGYYWCAIWSLLKNKEMEPAFFGAYLADRVLYSVELGHIKTLPQEPQKLLEIGDDITLSDVEKLLTQRKKELEKNDIEISPLIYVDITDPKTDNAIRVINPYLSKEEIKSLEKEAKSQGIETAPAEDYPTVRGRFAEETRAERYPTIRWNFKWQDYVIVGVPDGITKEFVYEFKSTRSKFISLFKRRVALTQADFYGYFFKRPRKRVQIYIAENNSIEMFDEPIDKENTIRTLNYFKKIDDGEPPKAPKKWKCKNCEFIDICPLQRK